MNEPNRPGSLKVYPYPFNQSGSIESSEYQAHSSKIISLCITYDDQNLISIGEDGCMMIWEIKDKEARMQKQKDMSLP